MIASTAEPSPRTRPPETRLFWLGAGLLLLLLGYRLWVLSQPHVGLYHDETYYYHWSLIPDFGYFSKPPMIAWVIGLSSSLWGATAFGIKLGPALCWFATALVMGALGARIAGVRAGVFAALVFYSTPLAGFYSLFATTDSVFLLCWSLALLGFIEAERRTKGGDDALGWWLLAGIATGLGLLSKYTMLALPAGLFCYLLATPRRRGQFRRLGPWLAGIVALALFGLNLAWNAANGFVAFRHTSEIARLDGPLLNPTALFEFWAAQLLIIGPLSAALLLRHWRRWWRELSANPGLQAAVWGGGLLLLGISAQALMSRAFANWAAPITLTATLLVAVLATTAGAWIRASIAANLIALALFYHWPSVLTALDIEATKRINPWLRAEPWGERVVAAPFMTAHASALPVASNSRAVLAELSFRLHPRRFPGAYWNPDPGHIRDYYDQTVNFARLPPSDAGATYLFATEAPLDPDILSRFAFAQPLGSVPEYFGWRPGRTLFLYEVQGFLGYDG